MRLHFSILRLEFCTLGHHVVDLGVHWDTKGDSLGSRVGFPLMTESTLWVIEVALGKRKLLERSEEEGVWGRSGPGAESLYGFFAIMGSFFRRSFDNF